MAAPLEFNVLLEDGEKLLQKISFLQKLGYEGVAINNSLPTLLDPPTGKKKKDQNKPEIKAPEEILIKENVLKSKIGVSRRPFKQYSRISMIQKSTQHAHIIETKPVQDYDLIAVQPTSEETFRQACTTLNIDIITIDVTESLGYRIKRPTVHKAIERGIHFELQYSPALRDRSLRKHLISNAMILVFWCKGKNVIVTSGCEKAIELRGPHDVANLGLLFNLSEAQAKDAVTRNCLAVLKHSESRRIVRSVLTVTKADSLPESEHWIRDKCNIDIDPATESDSDKSQSDTDDSEEDSNLDQGAKRKRSLAKEKSDTECSAVNKSSDLKAVGSVSPAKKMKT